MRAITTRKKLISDLLVFALMAVYALYAWNYIQETSFVIKGERYYALFDDAMISMRYAQNLAQGYGPVWNPGEMPVEGYSNPLWVVYMALLHLLPIAMSKISLVVQLSGLVSIAASLFVIKRVGDELSSSPLVGLLAALLTAFYMPLNNWALQGMEVSVLVLMVSTAAWMALRTAKTGRFNAWLYVLLGVSTFVRIDMAVPYVVILLYLLWADAANRRRHLIWGVGILVGSLAVQTLFRLVYYGELLPNTYYLKVTGIPLWFRIGAGLYAFLQFVWTTNWILYLIPLVYILAVRDRYGLLLVGIFLAVSAYSIYVGGDAWEHRGGANRFIAVGMPLFFVAFTYTLDQVRVTLLKQQPTWIQAVGWLTQVAVVLVCVFSFSNMIDQNFLNRMLLRRQPLFVRGTERYTNMGLLIKEFTEPQAQVAVVTAGAIPYFAERPAVDLMGKSDAVIAREPMRTNLSRQALQDFRPGHTKWNYAYSITEQQPDVIAQLWDETTDEAQSYMAGDYRRVVFDEIPMYLRLDSPYIDWDTVEQLADPEGGPAEETIDPEG